MTAGRELAGRIADRVRSGSGVERVEPVDAGSRRRTAVVHLAGADPVVVRIARNPEATRVEARLLEAVTERTSVPVPPVLEHGTVDGEGWLATGLVEGTDLHASFTRLDPDDRRRIARSFGRYLAELHDAFRFDACGPLTVADGDFAVDGSGDPAAVAGSGSDAGTTGGEGEDAGGTAEGWRPWLASFGRASLARLPAEFDAVRGDAAETLARVDADRTPVPRLFPWDLRPGNALLADGRVAAVVDWEGPLAAAPALAAAKTEYLVADWYVPSEAAALRGAFRAGYESVRTWPRVRPAHRVAAVVSSAVDSRGAVTNPGYPPVARAEAVRFHLRTLQGLL
jgi:hypothetical protein